MMKPWLIVFFWLGSVVLEAQSTTPITLFPQNQTYFNPGAMGYENVLSANFFARQSWVGFENAPSNQAFCAHAPLRNPSVAMGVLVEHDSWGLTNYTALYVNYAYRIRIGADRLALGLKLGVYSASQDYLNMRDEQQDPTNINGQTFLLPNSGMGVLYTSGLFWVGMSVPRMLGFKSDPSGSYKVDHSIANYEIYLSGGGKFKLNADLGLEPSLLLVQAKSLKYQFNVMGTYKAAYKAGLGYRQKEAVMLLLGYNLNHQVAVGYSYDLTVGELKDYSSGSHEIQLQYKFGYKVNASNPRGF